MPPPFVLLAVAFAPLQSLPGTSGARRCAAGRRLCSGSRGGRGKYPRRVSAAAPLRAAAARRVAAPPDWRSRGARGGRQPLGGQGLDAATDGEQRGLPGQRSPGRRRPRAFRRAGVASQLLFGGGLPQPRQVAFGGGARLGRGPRLRLGPGRCPPGFTAARPGVRLASGRHRQPRGGAGAGPRARPPEWRRAAALQLCQCRPAPRRARGHTTGQRLLPAAGPRLPLSGRGPAVPPTTPAGSGRAVDLEHVPGPIGRFAPAGSALSRLATAEARPALRDARTGARWGRDARAGRRAGAATHTRAVGPCQLLRGAAEPGRLGGVGRSAARCSSNLQSEFLLCCVVPMLAPAYVSSPQICNILASPYL
eukprot:scaffold4817_cov116-Isochrysis_galbana.AAC.2